MNAPELTLSYIFNERVDPDFYYPRHVVELLDANNYESLGWLNDGVFPPMYDDWTEVYQNHSGSYTIIASPSHKQFYCVDMGD